MQSLDQFALTTKPVFTFLKYRRKKGHSRKRTERSEVHLKSSCWWLGNEPFIYNPHASWCANRHRSSKSHSTIRHDL